jgi:hypothetical protein
MQGVEYLDLLRDLVQSHAFEPSQRNKLVYPIHNGALVVVITPETIWNDLGYDSTTESRHMSCRTSHVGETCLFIGTTVSTTFSWPICQLRILFGLQR